MQIFKEMLRAQWKWSWGAVLLASVAAFSIPLVSLQNAVIEGNSSQARYSWMSEAEHFLSVMDRWGVFYTVVAVAIGLAVAVLAWSADHRGRHVYTLVLPIERWRFVLLRFAAGGSLLLVPATVLLVGCLLAVGSVAIPAGLTAYPLELALRFTLAAVVAYGIFFAISSGTTRTAAMVLTPLLGLVLIDVVLSSVGVKLELLQNTALALFEWPGVMEVFTGRWLLIDV
jgi:hypothetical protein